jgi:hypothetical protein
MILFMALVERRRRLGNTEVVHARVSRRAFVELDLRGEGFRIYVP